MFGCYDLDVSARPGRWGMFRRLGGYGTLWKPKNPHSLEYLKYLQGVLVKNEKVTEGNKKVLVEALRAISEILIWGDQNDSSVFDFFLERQMLTHFLEIMKQDNGSSLCVQLLQTLNILFENIRHETSLYFLLSNNHVNEIIAYPFELRNEEIMAYYISFLKALSCKLNQATIHFFFNEVTNDFPLLTETLKLYDFSESMVRIAVRTIFLNIVRVPDENMQKFVHAASKEYLKEVVDQIVGANIDLDQFVRSAENVQPNRDRLRDKMDELVDSFHYVGELLHLGECMSDLAKLLSHRLIVPLLLNSLAPRRHDSTVLLSTVAALFSISQFIQVVVHGPLTQSLLTCLLFEDRSVLSSHWVRRDDSFCLQPTPLPAASEETKDERVFFNALLAALDVSKNDDYTAFFALYVIYAMFENKGDLDDLLAAARVPHATRRPKVDDGNDSPCSSAPRSSESKCDPRLMESLRLLVAAAARPNCRVRTVTLQLACLVLRHFVLALDCNDVHDAVRAVSECTKRALVGRLNDAVFVHHKDLFIDMFDDEYAEFEAYRLRLDAVGHELLLPPSSSPLSGLPLNKRIPSGREEATRATIQAYLHVRKLEKDMKDECEDELPIRLGDSGVAAIGDCINTNNSDLLSCTVCPSGGKGERLSRFLVTDPYYLILVDPSGKSGWGVVRFVGLLQDTSIHGEPTDSRALHIVVEGPAKATSNATWRVGGSKRAPLLQAKFLFDDHIRCMAAKQRLTKGRQAARDLKQRTLCRVLGIARPGSVSPRGNPFRVASGCAPGSVRKQEADDSSSVRLRSERSPVDDPMSDVESSSATPSSATASDPTQGPNPNLAPSLIVLGMAGSGKTTFVQRLTAHLHARKTPPYVVNLDPAVRKVPYPVNIDIRDTVKYKQVMSEYNLGPNGAILTSLNLFCTRFDQVIDLIRSRSESVPITIIDTPGQIEAFTWSASGTIITEALASSHPTVVAYVCDSARATSPATFMSNMLYACSILYRTKLPFFIIFNKADIVRPTFARRWMTDFERFDEALEESRGGYANDLARSLSLVLDEFYSGLKTVECSSTTGEGMEEVMAAVEHCTAEYRKNYVKMYAEMRAKKAEDEKRRIQLQEELKATDLTRGVKEMEIGTIRESDDDEE